MKKYVSDKNLGKFLQKLKGLFAKKSEAISQADADNRYLKLSGGTMTDSIVMSNGKGLKDIANTQVIGISNGSLTLGSTKTGQEVIISTASDANIKHGSYNILDAINTAANPTLAGTETALEGLKINGTSYKNQPSSMQYLTTAPSADNTDGLKIVVLSAEPATRYNGYLYIILGA